MIARRTSSRCARAERCVGSRCSALQRKYVDGAIGRTWQIGSTPYAARCWSMKVTITSVGGRAPPVRNTRTLSSESRSRGAARRLRVRAVSGAARSSVVRPGRWPASRSAWRTQRRSTSTGTPDFLGDRSNRRPLRRMVLADARAPVERRVHGAPGSTCLVVPWGTILSQNAPSDETRYGSGWKGWIGWQ